MCQYNCICICEDVFPIKNFQLYYTSILDNQKLKRCFPSDNTIFTFILKKISFHTSKNHWNPSCMQISPSINIFDTQAQTTCEKNINERDKTMKLLKKTTVCSINSSRFGKFPHQKPHNWHLERSEGMSCEVHHGRRTQMKVDSLRHPPSAAIIPWIVIVTFDTDVRS